MKKKTTILAIILAIFSGAGIFLWQGDRREQNRHSPASQMEKAQTLAIALTNHQQDTGQYPTNLSQLVTEGTLSADQLHNLQFRQSPQDPPQNWLYQTPKKSSDYMLLSPVKLHLSEGSSGSWIGIKGDCSAHLIPHAKTHHLPDWTQKQPKQ